MGLVSSRASNHLDNITETVTRILQENAQACQVNSTQIQQLAFGGQCSNITIRNVDFNQLAGIDFQCMQDADLNAKVASEMTVQLEQLAKSLVDGLNFNLASLTESDNFIKNHVRLVTEIMNQLKQSCTVNAGQYQGISCTDQAHDILVENVSFNQIVESVFKCAQKGTTVADVKTQIEQFIKQTAISENKGFSFNLLFIILIVVIVGGAIFLLNKITDWKFLVIGLPILAIIIYLIVANIKNWWPFKSKFDDKKRAPEAALPTPPPPAFLQELEAQQRLADAQAQQVVDNLTPSQYRRLRFAGTPVFSRPYQQRACAARQPGMKEVKPVRLAMKRPEAILV